MPAVINLYDTFCKCGHFTIKRKKDENHSLSLDRQIAFLTNAKCEQFQKIHVKHLLHCSEVKTITWLTVTTTLTIPTDKLIS